MKGRGGSTGSSGVPLKGILSVLNDLKRLRLFKDYAIGGGMGAMRYMEPFTTRDLNVFFAPAQEGLTAGLPEIFAELRKRGYPSAGEGVEIGGFPVQFLATDPLTEEAVRKATKVDYAGIPTKVMSVEHLIAIAVRTGRKKDVFRVEEMMVQAEIDMKVLRDILSRHGLEKAFRMATGKPA